MARARPVMGRWDELSAAKRAELGFEKRDDGLFWMGWDDFRRKFGLIEVCKVAMPGQRANFHGAEVAAGNALLEEVRLRPNMGTPPP
eukprot:2433044-Prymnesium_polylepis.1